MPPPFPTEVPAGFPAIDPALDTEFDPALHLALTQPTEVYSLSDLGYDPRTIAAAPSPIAATSCFRILSDSGVAALQRATRGLEPYCPDLQRISRAVRGGVYQSRFLRGLCLSPEVAEHCANLMQTPLHPHSLPHQLGHLNYTPKTPGENVDKWHVDTLRFDYVLFVTDPQAVAGGEFQYFKGTKQEMADLYAANAPFPEDRIVSPDIPGPGYAVMQQGNLVVHRAKGLNHKIMNKSAYTGMERITMVNGYVPADMTHPDFTAFDQIYKVDPKATISGEYARHAAWMGTARLAQTLATIPGEDSKEALAAHLRAAAADLSAAAQALEQAQDGHIAHFGDG